MLLFFFFPQVPDQSYPRTPMGYALLTGVGGNDKQSLLRLAGYICSLEVLQITVKKDDRIQELRVNC